MWFVFFLTLAAIFSFVREKLPIEVTSVLLLTALLIFGQLFPIYDQIGTNKIDAANLLSGFSNPMLVAVLALLVMGQAIIRTDALQLVTSVFVTKNKAFAWFSIGAIFLFVVVMSSFMNNTPLVIIFIPILQVLAN